VLLLRLNSKIVGGRTSSSLGDSSADQGVGDVVAGADDFGFGGALRVELLLGRLANEAAAAERHDAAGMAAHVRMRGERGIDPGHE
jgi:hypothetical protein